MNITTSERLDQYEAEIQEAESHIANARAWIKIARDGELDTVDYTIGDALGEASAILLAAIDEDDDGGPPVT